MGGPYLQDRVSLRRGCPIGSNCDMSDTRVKSDLLMWIRPISLTFSVDGWLDGWVDRWLEGWMTGWRDGWLAGWMGG